MSTDAPQRIELMFQCKNFFKTALRVSDAFRNIAHSNKTFQITIDDRSQRDAIKVSLLPLNGYHIIQQQFDMCLPTLLELKFGKDIKIDLLDMIISQFRGTHSEYFA